MFVDQGLQHNYCSTRALRQHAVLSLGPLACTSHRLNLPNPLPFCTKFLISNTCGQPYNPGHHGEGLVAHVCLKQQSNRSGLCSSLPETGKPATSYPIVLSSQKITCRQNNSVSFLCAQAKGFNLVLSNVSWQPRQWWG